LLLSTFVVNVGVSMFEEYLGKKVLIIESHGEQTTGILQQIFYSESRELISVKIKTQKSEVIVPFPFKLKHESEVSL